MTTITLEEKTREALEMNAACRGLTLPDYLALIAKSDGSPSGSSVGVDRLLADVLGPILAEARQATFVPRQPSTNPVKSGFDAALTEKFRKQGFNL